MLKTKNQNQIKIGMALIPVIFLISLLFYNIRFRDSEWFGAYSNQLILVLSGLVAFSLGFNNRISLNHIFKQVIGNIKSVWIPICILFMVGALSGSWLVSGIIPSMVYYGVQILQPNLFLPAVVIITALVSLMTGSSWTTSATIGMALIGIGEVLGVPKEMVAGAVISGAYFGDKLSPMSDTTNLASAIAGANLYSHIKYMMFTTVPTFLITLFVFVLLNLSIDISGDSNIDKLLDDIDQIFNISPVLFVVPLIVVVLVVYKVKTLAALLFGVVLSIVFAFVYQLAIIIDIDVNFFNAIIDIVLFDVEIKTDNILLQELFVSDGILGMVWTILLILSAMFFGGVMEGIGALEVLTKSLMKFSKTSFQLILTTVISCLGLNLLASDQYLAIVIPGKMLKKGYKEKYLAPENLSRTLEDSGTVTSVLIPWNTCGAYQATVLGVDVWSYLPYAIFNWLSPFMTLIFAALSIKIKQLKAN